MSGYFREVSAVKIQHLCASHKSLPCSGRSLAARSSLRLLREEAEGMRWRQMDPHSSAGMEPGWAAALAVVLTRA